MIELGRNAMVPRRTALPGLMSFIHVTFTTQSNQFLHLGVNQLQTLTLRSLLFEVEYMDTPRDTLH